MPASLIKAYSLHPAGTYLCDDNHGRWFMVLDASTPSRATLRELTDEGYATLPTVADVRAYTPLTPNDVETWQQDQDYLRDEREDRWSGSYWED